MHFKTFVFMHPVCPPPFAVGRLCYLQTHFESKSNFKNLLTQDTCLSYVTPKVKDL